MTKRLADGGEVDARLQQENCRRVPQGMRVDPLLPQGAGCSGSGADVLLDQVPDTEARELRPLTVDEQRRFAASRARVAGAEIPQKPRGLRPNRAESGLATFAPQPDLLRRLGVSHRRRSRISWTRAPVLLTSR
jgi:hypothetical protein